MIWRSSLRRTSTATLQAALSEHEDVTSYTVEPDKQRRLLLCGPCVATVNGDRPRCPTTPS